MKLISKIHISRFRSVKELELTNLQDFTALAGLNNSGKSNVLRALHAFFTGEVEPDIRLDVARDFYRSELRDKKKKRIRVSVSFSLPSHFKFRSGLEPVESLLGRSFTLTKEWDRDTAEPSYYLNNDDALLGLEESAKVRQFLGMVSFRYIPNRVVPTDVIRKEQGALRDALMRRLGKNAPNAEALFRELRSTSENLIKGVASHFRQVVPDVTALRLKTPENWAEILFALGYQLASGNVQVDDTLQGSGVQSVLMFETLALIDRDYFQQFGWRQAAIWAVEEPESSLHASLELQLALHLSSLANEGKGRLQIAATTHSELMLQYADATAFLERREGATVGRVLDIREAVDRATHAGISKWTHPLLYYPLDPLVLVEGQYDVDFLKVAFRLLRPSADVRVECIGSLEGEPAKSGVDRLTQYLKEHKEAVKARRGDARLLVVLDWDAASKKGELEKPFLRADPITIVVWPQDALNPKLGGSFRGIERSFSDRLIRLAESQGADVATNRRGVRFVERETYGDVKKKLNTLVKNDLTTKDLEHCQSFLESLLTLVGVAKVASTPQAAQSTTRPRRPAIAVEKRRTRPARRPKPSIPEASLTSQGMLPKARAAAYFSNISGRHSVEDARAAIGLSNSFAGRNQARNILVRCTTRGLFGALPPGCMSGLPLGTPPPTTLRRRPLSPRIYNQLRALDREDRGRLTSVRGLPFSAPDSSATDLRRAAAGRPESAKPGGSTVSLIEISGSLR